MWTMSEVAKFPVCQLDRIVDENARDIKPFDKKEPTK